MVLSGSLPPDCRRALVRQAHRRSQDGRSHASRSTPRARRSLRPLADTSHLPDLLKPNAEELASLTGDDWTALEADPIAAAAAAARLVKDGVGAVLLTLGSEGAVLITDEGTWRATPPPITLRSTVGAGDASLAGYLLADLRGLEAPERLREAVAYGAAAASLNGSTMPREEDLNRDDVVVTELTAAIEQHAEPRTAPNRGNTVPQLINEQLVVLDQALGDTKDDVIVALAQRVADAGRSDNPDGLANDAFAREAKSATGMPGGLAIPHCRSEHVTESTLVFARLAPPIDFGAKDQAADLVFMIAAPASGDQEHMKLLTKLARALVRPEFTSALRIGCHQRRDRRPGERCRLPRRSRRRPRRPRPRHLRTRPDRAAARRAAARARTLHPAPTRRV